MSRPAIEVIAGCMFSGKTEEVVRLARRDEIAGRRVLVITPAVDDRVGSDRVLSRSGVAFPSRAVASSSEIEAVVAAADADVVAIEEAQFFDAGLPAVVSRLVDGGVRVIASGLDRDFAGRPFGPMPELLALADEVRKLSAVCVVCGEDATCTQRLVDGRPAAPDDPIVVIGGMEDRGEPDRYEARCRRCHVIAPARGAAA